MAKQKVYVNLYIGALCLGILFTSFSPVVSHQELKSLISELKGKNKTIPDNQLIQKSLRGYFLLKQQDKIRNSIITIIDFRSPSTIKRMWVINVKTRKLLFHSLVAHGKNSGGKYAKKFSNIPGSLQSSLGFYITGKTYLGKHGVSLYLHGLEKGFNDNAKKRAIVMHGASYVSNSFIQQYGRLGRSFGCPAIPLGNHEKIINTIKGGSCLFIYYPEKEYEKRSKYISNKS